MQEQHDSLSSRHAIDDNDVRIDVLALGESAASIAVRLECALSIESYTYFYPTEGPRFLRWDGQHLVNLSCTQSHPGAPAHGLLRGGEVLWVLASAASDWAALAQLEHWYQLSAHYDHVMAIDLSNTSGFRWPNGRYRPLFGPPDGWLSSTVEAAITGVTSTILDGGLVCVDYADMDVVFSGVSHTAYRRLEGPEYDTVFSNMTVAARQAATESLYSVFACVNADQTFSLSWYSDIGDQLGDLVPRSTLVVVGVPNFYLSGGRGAPAIDLFFSYCV